MRGFNHYQMITVMLNLYAFNIDKSNIKKRLLTMEFIASINGIEQNRQPSTWVYMI